MVKDTEIQNVIKIILDGKKKIELDKNMNDAYDELFSESQIKKEK